MVVTEEMAWAEQIDYTGATSGCQKGRRSSVAVGLMWFNAVKAGAGAGRFSFSVA